MSPNELEKRIIDSLQQGACGLPDLTKRARADGREVLKLLHIMAADKRVRSSLMDGGVIWGLGANAGAQERPAPKAPAPIRPQAPDRPSAAAIKAIPQHTTCDRVAAGFAQGESLTLSELAQRFPELKRNQVKTALKTLAQREIVHVEGWARGARWSLIDSAERKAAPVAPVTAVIAPPPVKVAPAPVNSPKRTRNKTIIVRPAVQITELSVSPLPGGSCMICDGDKIGTESVGDPAAVIIPIADIPGLIEALNQLLMAQAA